MIQRVPGCSVGDGGARDFGVQQHGRHQGQSKKTKKFECGQPSSSGTPNPYRVSLPCNVVRLQRPDAVRGTQQHHSYVERLRTPSLEKQDNVMSPGKKIGFPRRVVALR